MDGSIDTVLRRQDRDAFMQAFEDTTLNKKLVDLIALHRRLSTRQQRLPTFGWVLGQLRWYVLAGGISAVAFLIWATADFALH